MKATDVIRNILDLIDNIDDKEQVPTLTDVTDTHTAEHGDDVNRFKQIMDLLTSKHQMYDNSPAEVVATIDAVTTDAGGGWNGPKNPADMRSDSVSLYPNHIHKPGA